MARIAAKLAARADDGDIIDNKAPGQPFKDTGKKDSDLQSGTTKFESSWELDLDRKSLKP